MFGIPGKPPVTMTPAAEAQIARLMAKGDTKGLRIGVKKGGCAGMEYTMDYVAEIAPHDEVVEQNGARVMIAPMAQMFLFGTEIDYATGLLESGFRFNNPNVIEACGCGEFDQVRRHVSLPTRLPSASPASASSRADSRTGELHARSQARRRKLEDERARRSRPPCSTNSRRDPARARLRRADLPARDAGRPPRRRPLRRSAARTATPSRPAPTPATSPPRCWPTPARSR